MRTSPPERIPVTLIGGYLGAGKTSLLRHLLTHAAGERISVLVNDFGAIGLDAALVARSDAETVTLTNGCVCCSIADDFGAALDAQVRSAEPPARIVVETSGVAEPGKSASYAGGWPGVRLDAVITVVDLETVRTQARDRFVGNLIVRQIESADLIVANKSDRVTLPARRSTTDWLADHARRATLLEACHGRVAPAIVLGLDVPDEGDLAAGTGEGEARFRPPVEPGASATGTHEADGPDAHSATGGEAHPPFVRVSCHTREPFDRARLAAALDALPDTVVRFKGVVRLRDRPDRPFVLQGVGCRWSLEPAPPRVSAILGIDDGSAIDFIGVGPVRPIQSAVRSLAPELRCGGW